MPRLAPQTVFTAVADSAANAQAAKNASLPLPGKTGARESKIFLFLYINFLSMS